MTSLPPNHNFSKPPVMGPPPANPMKGVIILSCIVGGIVLYGTIALVAMVMSRRPRQPSGFISARPMKNGWSWYHIPELELSLASNHPPESITSPNGYLQSTADNPQYAACRIDGPHLHTLIVAYWNRKTYNEAYIVSREKRNLEKFRKGFTRSEVTTTEFGGRRATRYTIEFPYKGYDWVQSEAIVVRGNDLYYFQTMYPKTPDGWAPKAVDYMLRTARFDP